MYSTSEIDHFCEVLVTYKRDTPIGGKKYYTKLLAEMQILSSVSLEPKGLSGFMIRNSNNRVYSLVN